MKLSKSETFRLTFQLVMLTPFTSHLLETCVLLPMNPFVVSTKFGKRVQTEQRRSAV